MRCTWNVNPSVHKQGFSSNSSTVCLHIVCSWVVGGGGLNSCKILYDPPSVKCVLSDPWRETFASPQLIVCYMLSPFPRASWFTWHFRELPGPLQKTVDWMVHLERFTRNKKQSCLSSILDFQGILQQINCLLFTRGTTVYEELRMLKGLCFDNKDFPV